MAWAKQVICRGASREGHRGPQGPRYFRPGGGLSRRTLRRGTAENRPCPGPGTRSAAPPFGRAFFQPGPEFKRGYSSADSRNDPCMEHSGYLRNPRLRRSIFNVRPDRSPFGRPACPDRPPPGSFPGPRQPGGGTVYGAGKSYSRRARPGAPFPHRSRSPVRCSRSPSPAGGKGSISPT